MIGLMILLFFGLYLAATIWVTRAAANWAERNDRSRWRWGSLAAFAMYNLVFWDFIPTLVAHNYYCSTEAGFWAYKTPEQWKTENPGEMETLKESLSPTRLGHEKPTAGRNWLTQRFYNEVTRKHFLHSLSREENKFFDAKNGELIAISVNFWRGKSGGVFGLGGTPDELRQALVLGWGNRQCDTGGKSPTDTFDQYIYQFWKSGQNK